ncbi:hypothetical protein OG453_09405 [Streptomyces sp. NBC_01381]|uniref:hypothetical protein n=1 Tax=Streptomyces sp. NBC_01381 TaxID=2903845 RepID=UPI0022502296|nr:hypothetical protein [Streptomyces sp. NBC_01381]MCX4666882.1 hypothetical protein [Streptomyces sp. NBC_01381]
MIRRPTLLVAAALTAAVVVASLSACGGGDEKIAGVGSGETGRTSPSPAVSGDGIDRPEIRLPKGVENTFEGGETGDVKKDAVLADNQRVINSIDEAITVDAKKHPALEFYSAGDALVSAATYVQSFYDAGVSWVGLTRYYDQQVTFLKGGAAAVTYCGDETKAYSANRKTGAVKKTPGDSDDYISYNVRMEKNTDGVWQATSVTSEEGAQKCQP